MERKYGDKLSIKDSVLLFFMKLQLLNEKLIESHFGTFRKGSYADRKRGQDVDIRWLPVNFEDKLVAWIDYDGMPKKLEVEEGAGA